MLNDILNYPKDNFGKRDVLVGGVCVIAKRYLHDVWSRRCVDGFWAPPDTSGDGLTLGLKTETAWMLVLKILIQNLHKTVPLKM